MNFLSICFYFRTYLSPCIYCTLFLYGVQSDLVTFWHWPPHLDWSPPVKPSSVHHPECDLQIAIKLYLVHSSILFNVDSLLQRNHNALYRKCPVLRLDITTRRLLATDWRRFDAMFLASSADGITPSFSHLSLVTAGITSILCRKSESFIPNVCV